MDQSEPITNDKKTLSSLVIQRYIFIFAIAFISINMGGTNNASQSLLSVIFSGLILASSLRPIRNRLLSRIWFVAWFCFIVLVGYGFIQSLRMEFHPFENSIWPLARAQLGNVAGAISVAPETSRASLVGLAPMLAFPLSILLFQREEDAFWLLHRLAYFSGALALYGLVQHLFFPNQLGFYEKVYYLQSLTATFVNRNSAGTFFGVGACLSTGLALYYLRKIDPSKLVSRLMRRRQPSSRGEGDIYPYRAFALFSGVALIQLLALFLTQSRGAALTSFVGLAVLVVMMMRHGLIREGMSLNLLKLPKKLKIIATFISVLLIFWFLGGQASYRMEAHGVDDARLCVYRSILMAIADQWPLGSGFGTFQDVFPSYRNSECAGVYGSWDIAHNSYLEGMLEMGFVFIAAILVGYYTLIRALLLGYISRRRYRVIPVIGLSVLILISLHALVDFSLQIPGVSTFVAALLGACVTISLGRERLE